MDSSRSIFVLFIVAIAVWTPSDVVIADDGIVGSAPVTPVIYTPHGAIEPNWGTAAVIREVLGSNTFNPRFASATWTYSAGVARHLTAAGNLQTTLNLPSGAAIESISIRGCDTSTTDQVTASLAVCDTIGAGCFSVAGVATGVADTPGCGIFTALAGGSAIGNGNRVYLVSVSTGFTNATTFDAIYVDYKLRVSDAPPTATFSDVPTSHPFFQYIEALAASGITAGCTAPPNPNYCPDSSLTRGQMAVFLARALGLHWSP